MVIIATVQNEGAGTFVPGHSATVRRILTS